MRGDGADLYTKPVEEIDNPLADMGEWIRTGAPPSARELQLAGLTDDHRTNTPWDRWTEISRIRHEWFVREFGYSIPCAESIAAIIEHSPVIEVAAGTGYYGAMARAAGADVISTDAHPWGLSAYYFRTGAQNPDLIGGYDGEHAALDHPDRTVMLSWGGFSDEADWQVALLRAMRRGRRLILFGEPPGGCTTCDAFFDYLHEEFEHIREVRIPTFPSIHDRMSIHERKGMRLSFNPNRLP